MWVRTYQLNWLSVSKLEITRQSQSTGKHLEKGDSLIKQRLLFCELATSWNKLLKVRAQNSKVKSLQEGNCASLLAGSHLWFLNFPTHHTQGIQHLPACPEGGSATQIWKKSSLIQNPTWRGWVLANPALTYKQLSLKEMEALGLASRSSTWMDPSFHSISLLTEFRVWIKWVCFMFGLALFLCERESVLDLQWGRACKSSLEGRETWTPPTFGSLVLSQYIKLQYPNLNGPCG